MKKITTLFLSLMSTALIAQIPNPSFENWTAGAPDNWTVYTFFAPGSVTESNTAHAGSHSVSLNSVLVSSRYYGGFIQTGPSLGDMFFANSGNPAALNGWYQLTTSGGDQFYIQVVAKMGSSAIGSGSLQIPWAASVWKHFSVCINYTSGTADSMSIQLELANGVNPTNPGSVLLIDDLSFGSCTAGIDEIGQNVKLEPSYPNPASTICNVIFSIPGYGRVNADLYDMTGRKVMDLLQSTQMSPGQYKIPVDVSGLANGIYIYRITVDGTTYSQKLTVAR